MSNFTDEELESAVSQYVRGEVDTERTELGPLSTDYAFAELREFAASTLVFDPSAIFYLLSLAANRVNQDVLLALEYLADIQTAIEEMGRDTKKVQQTSLLEDAAAALLEVERIIANNSAISQRQFSRYERALDTFTDKALTPNVRNETGSGFPQTYEIVRPPQAAQTAIKSSISELRTLHEDIIAEVDQLRVAMSEFLAENLPLLSIQNTVQLVRADLRELKSEFDDATDEGAIEMTRDAFLRIQAGKSTVTNLTTISDPREDRMASGASSTDRLKAVSPASSSTPAELLGTRSAPYHIDPASSDTVKLAVDGGSDQTVTLTPNPRAFLLGASGETFDIHLASRALIASSSGGPYTVPAAPNNVFAVYIDGVGYSATLTSGVRTAAQIGLEIEAATRIDGGSGTFGSVGAAGDPGTGLLVIQHDTEGDGSLVIGSGQTTLNTALGFTDGQSDEGEDANNVIQFYMDDQTIITATLTVGAARTAAQVAADIDAQPSIIASTETVDADPTDITVVRVQSIMYGSRSSVLVYPTTDVHRAAMETLGFFDEQQARSEDLSLADTVTQLNAGLSGATAEAEEETVQSGTGNGTALVSGVFRLPSGTITVSITTDDKLYISGTGLNAGWYAISSISLGGAYDELTLGRLFPETVEDDAFNMDWEIHRDLLKITSDGTDVSSALEPKTANANTELGLSATKVWGAVSGIRVYDSSTQKDLSLTGEDVKINDIVTIYGVTETVHTVTEVTYDGYQAEVTPEVSNELASSPLQYKIQSEGAVEYEVFEDDLADWYTDTLAPTKFDDDILELERVLNPLLVSKNPSAALVGTARTTANSLETVYDELSTVLAAFEVTEVGRIDALLNMLQERGLDRAHDLLLLGEIEEFFDADKDVASYGGNLLEKMRAIAQNDVPIGRSDDEDHLDTRLTGSEDDADPNLDFSDQDDESGVTEIDDVPDLEDDEDILNQGL